MQTVNYIWATADDKQVNINNWEGTMIKNM